MFERKVDDMTSWAYSLQATIAVPECRQELSYYVSETRLGGSQPERHHVCQSDEAASSPIVTLSNHTFTSCEQSPYNLQLLFTSAQSRGHRRQFLVCVVVIHVFGVGPPICQLRVVSLIRNNVKVDVYVGQVVAAPNERHNDGSDEGVSRVVL